MRQTKSNRLFQYQQYVLRSSVPWPVKSIVLLLSTYMNTTKLTCFPKQGTLARAAGLTQRTICRNLAAAEEAGLIRKISSTRRRSLTYEGILPGPPTGEAA